MQSTASVQCGIATPAWIIAAQPMPSSVPLCMPTSMPIAAQAGRAPSSAACRPSTRGRSGRCRRRPPRCPGPNSSKLGHAHVGRRAASTPLFARSPSPRCPSTDPRSIRGRWRRARGRCGSPSSSSRIPADRGEGACPCRSVSRSANSAVAVGLGREIAALQLERREAVAVDEAPRERRRCRRRVDLLRSVLVGVRIEQVAGDRDRIALTLPPRSS